MVALCGRILFSDQCWRCQIHTLCCCHSQIGKVSDKHTGGSRFLPGDGQPQNAEDSDTCSQCTQCTE